MPEAHAGRLLDHVHLRVIDVEASKRFYAVVGEAIGVGPLREGEGWFSLDELFVSDDGPPTSGLHLAFQAPDRDLARQQREHDGVLPPTVRMRRV